MNAWLIDPNSKQLQWWDVTTMTALVFTAFVTPFEISLIRETKTDALFVINQIVNVIFLIDIGLNFFMPYRLKPHEGGALVRDHRRIADNYLHGWFAIDVVSLLPVDLIEVTGLLSAMAGGGEMSQSTVSTIRLVRLLRLLKLARIFRASKILARWENKFAWTYTTKQALFYITVIIVTVHWLACCWAMLAQMHTGQRTDALRQAIR